jgi:hypothetical protein
VQRATTWTGGGCHRSTTACADSDCRERQRRGGGSPPLMNRGVQRGEALPLHVSPSARPCARPMDRGHGPCTALVLAPAGRAIGCAVRCESTRCCACLYCCDDGSLLSRFLCGGEVFYLMARSLCSAPVPLKSTMVSSHMLFCVFIIKV